MREIWNKTLKKKKDFPDSKWGNYILMAERMKKLISNTYLLWLCSVAIVALILEPDENEIILLLDKTRSSIFQGFFFF